MTRKLDRFILKIAQFNNSTNQEKEKLDIFILKIALLNATGFCFISGITTFIDARLTSHVAFGSRHYPLGLNICWGGLLIFIVSSVAAHRDASDRFKMLFPTFVLLIVSIASLINFLPEFPHGGITGGVMACIICGLISSYIHYYAIPCKWISDIDISTNFKIERIKEYVVLWRTVAISLGFGYLALLVPWSSLIWMVSPRVAPKPDEAFLLTQISFAQPVFVSIYVLVGPVWEAFKKAHDAADLFLNLK